MDNNRSRMTGNFMLASFFLFLLPPEAISGEKLKVYHFNKNLKINRMNKIEGVQADCLYYGGKFKLPLSLTSCYRWSAFQYTTIHRVLFTMQIGIINSDFSDLEQGFLFGYWDTGPWLGYRLKDKAYNWFAHVPIGSQLHTWTHTCFTFDLNTGSYKLAENGKIVFRKFYPSLTKASQLLNLTFNFFSVGCVNKKENFKYSVMHGKVTDVQVWEKELEDDEMIAITSCKNVSRQGTFLNWSTTDWTFAVPRNLSELEIHDMKEVCNFPERSFLFFPIPSTFDRAEGLTCKKFSGSLVGYVTKGQFEEIANFMSKRKYFYNDQCMFAKAETSNDLAVWLRLTDNVKEGQFKDDHTGKAPDYFPWYENTPVANSTTYNCVNILVRGSINDDEGFEVLKSGIKDELCFDKKCSLCETPTFTNKILVRGLCEESAYDTEYNYIVADNGTPMYVGILTSAIWYDEKRRLWVWIDRKMENDVATSNSRVDSLFIGVNAVNFENSSDPCIKDQAIKVINIKLTTCIGDDQFTCNNGLCIPMNERCDQNINCDDESDEIDCKMLEMNKNYNRRIPPFTFDYEKNKKKPIEVAVSITIIKFLKIAEVDHLYKLKFVLQMEWYDYRLQFHNLKPKRSENALTVEESKKIWIPSLIFSNTQENDATTATRNTLLTVSKEGNYTRSMPEVVEEINIYKGKENRLTFEMTFTKDFECEYQLSMYPFDMQTCAVNLEVNALEQQSLKIVPKTVQMKGKIELTQYIVTAWKLVYKNDSNHSKGIQMIFQLKRRIINQLLTSFLPTFIILVIVYCTNYFKLSHFNTALTINLTSMLVLTTLFIGVSNSLPRVAYIKVTNKCNQCF